MNPKLTIKRKKFRYQNYEISYLDAGTGSPLIFVHAFPFNAKMWEPQITYYAKTHRVIAPDFPSFGSSSPTPPKLSMALAADILNALLEHLQYQTSMFIGLSMGGYILLALAEKYPHRIKKLVLADTRGTADSTKKKTQRLEAIKRLETEGKDWLITSFPDLIIGKTTHKKHPEIVNEVQELMKMASPEIVISALKGMAERPNRLDVLQTLDVPCCIIVGDEDKLTPISDAETLLKHTRQGTLFVFPNVGHMSNLENPKLFNTIIKNYLLK